MKNLLFKLNFYLYLLLLPFTAYAGSPNPVPSPTPINATIINELQSDVLAKAFEGSIYGTFAPKLVGNGRYGAGFSLTHPISDYGFAGVRFDVLGDAYTAGTLGGGLKASFTLWGHKITPYVGAGVKSVLAGDGTETGNVSASAYTGFDASLWTSKSDLVDIGIKGEMEYDSAHSGIQIFHGGPYAGIKF